MPRTTPHQTETHGKDYIRYLIDHYTCNSTTALFRDITERDYGIDGLIELFDNGFPTGQIALVQLKASNLDIKALKKTNFVSCTISSSNAYYAFQNNIPVIIFYISLTEPNYFYYAKIQDIMSDNKEKITTQKSITLHIPIENRQENNVDPAIQIIKQNSEVDTQHNGKM